jgi:hypothetical protein
LAGALSSISTPVAAVPQGRGFHGGGGGGFRGGGFRGSGGFHDGGGFRGGHHHDRGGGIGLVFGPPFDDFDFDGPYYYDDPNGYDDASSYDDESSACGSWAWDAGRGQYDWIPC